MPLLRVHVREELTQPKGIVLLMRVIQKIVKYGVTHSANRFQLTKITDTCISNYLNAARLSVYLLTGTNGQINTSFVISSQELRIIVLVLSMSLSSLSLSSLPHCFALVIVVVVTTIILVDINLSDAVYSFTRGDTQPPHIIRSYGVYRLIAQINAVCGEFYSQGDKAHAIKQSSVANMPRDTKTFQNIAAFLWTIFFLFN
ncbi:hypothetical protein KIN20_022941 [Parelaphostrongylus tenuis]|uniref:Uncharacterized protein n=1 Tax=Parelaphostrongylus tenuis TaxID=148309 RepID=A0AAD5NBW4_PARTN|nr:hypothetical protein KIN20_022941 [Parelaphostrongylus tenuis]